MRSLLLPLLREALEAIGAPAGIAIPLGPPREAGNGDLATSVALKLARELGAAPRAIAERIVAAMRIDREYLREPEIAGAGFINFHFTPRFFQMRLAGALASGERFGASDIGRGRHARIEYVTVNRTAPAHLGRFRAEVIGDAIAATLTWCGYEVVRQTRDAETAQRAAATIVVADDDGERRVNVNQGIVLVEGPRRRAASELAERAIALDTLIEDLGADLVRFPLLMREAGLEIEFDLGLAREHSERNPYYYLRYALARVSGVLRHAESEGMAPAGDAELALLQGTEELDLIRSILHFPEKIERAANDLEPGIIADYLRDLATTFNRFYNACRIVAEPPPIRAARMLLLLAARTTLRNGMSILGLAVNE